MEWLVCGIGYTLAYNITPDTNNITVVYSYPIIINNIKLLWHLENCQLLEVGGVDLPSTHLQAGHELLVLYPLLGQTFTYSAMKKTSR